MFLYYKSGKNVSVPIKTSAIRRCLLFKGVLWGDFSVLHYCHANRDDSDWTTTVTILSCPQVRVMGAPEDRGRHVCQTADVVRCTTKRGAVQRLVRYATCVALQARSATGSGCGCCDSWGGGGVVDKAPVAASTMVVSPAGWRSKTSAHYRWSFVRSPICSSAPPCSTPWSPRRRYAGNKRWTVSVRTPNLNDIMRLFRPKV